MFSMSLSSSHENKADRWGRVDDVIQRILEMRDVTQKEWQNMFSDVFTLIIWGESDASQEMKERLRVKLEEYIRRVNCVMENLEITSLLHEYNCQWKKFSDRMEYLPMPFGQLETHVSGQHQTHDPNKRQMKDNSVRKLMLETWRNQLYENMSEKLTDGAVKMLQDERDGQIIDSNLITGLIDSFITLSSLWEREEKQYALSMEGALINGLHNYYRVRISDYIQEHGIRSYMIYAQQTLKDEKDRAMRYFGRKSDFTWSDEYMAACTKLFVVDCVDQILAEFPKLLREEDMVQVRCCYDLLHQVDHGVETLLQVFEEYTRQIGLEDIRNNVEIMLKDPDKYVCRLLDLYNRLSRLVADAFNNDPMLLTSRDRAYQEIVNNTSIFTTDIPSSVRSTARRVESRCPELLATYCDLLLRKSPTNRRLTSDEVESRLKDTLLVLKYVNSKDIFIRVYKSHLMRRLILETSADTGLEEMMVERMRELGVPAEQINKLGRMFQDTKLSHDFTLRFRDKYRSHLHSNVDSMHVLIISSGSWLLRSEQKVPISLPAEIEDYLPQLEDFYKLSHQGRSLAWLHHLSHGTVLYTNKHGRVYELELTTYQFVILFAWNLRYNESLRMEALLTATGLPETDLRRTLWTLTHFPKLEQQLILYNPPVNSDKEFNEATQFRLNLDFASSKGGKVQSRRRFNLIGRLQLSQESTTEEENLAIVELRQLRAQEGIIKIMKARKQISHNELYQELVDLLRHQFVPSKRLIKEVLEWLIEHNYIRRLDSDMNTFVYVT